MAHWKGPEVPRRHGEHGEETKRQGVAPRATGTVRANSRVPFLRASVFSVSPWYFGALPLALCLLISGCRPAVNPQSSSVSAQGGAAGSTLHLAQSAEPTTFDPATVQDGPTIEVLMHVFDGLVQWTPQNKLAPALAEKWD